MKKCPYCAEEIQEEAIVCRFCGRELTKAPPQPLTRAADGTMVRQYSPRRKTFNVIIMALLITLAVFFCVLSDKFGDSSDRSLAIPTVDRNMGSYKFVSYDDFYTYPDKYTGTKVNVKCKVFNVIDDQRFQCYLGQSYDAVYVTSYERYSGLYEDAVISVYGVGDGEVCGTNKFGAEVCSPSVISAWLQKMP